MSEHVVSSGETWSEEAKDAFEDLSHTAKWNVVIAHTVSYRQTNGQSMPCVELVDTNGPTVRLTSLIWLVVPWSVVLPLAKIQYGRNSPRDDIMETSV